MITFMQRHHVKTPDGHLEFTVTHRPRVKKRLHLELDEQGRLLVVAPSHWSKRQVNKLVVQNLSRVQRFLVQARQRHTEPLGYTNGEMHLYLGKPYALEVDSIQGRRAHVELADEKIQIHLPRETSKPTQSVLDAWYLKQARGVFGERLACVSQNAAWVKHHEITLMLRRMKRTWGNCSSSGVIKLNTHLIKAPVAIIDSVIAHELCHLREMNHGRAFYTLLQDLNPDWKQHRKILVAQGNSYLL